MPVGCNVVVESCDEAADSVTLRLTAGAPLNLGFRAASKIFVDEFG